MNMAGYSGVVGLRSNTTFLIKRLLFLVGIYSLVVGDENVQTLKATHHTATSAVGESEKGLHSDHVMYWLQPSPGHATLTAHQETLTIIDKQ